MALTRSDKVRVLNVDGVSYSLPINRFFSLAEPEDIITTSKASALTIATDDKIVTMDTSASNVVGTVTTQQVANLFVKPPYITKSATYTITSSDYLVNCTSGTFNLTLPTAASIEGRVFVIKNSGAGVITLNTTSSQTIDGAATVTLNQWDKVSVVSDGSNWLTI